MIRFGTWMYLIKSCLHPGYSTQPFFSPLQSTHEIQHSLRVGLGDPLHFSHLLLEERGCFKKRTIKIVPISAADAMNWQKWICNWSQPRVAKGAVGAIGLLSTLCIKPSAKKASSPPGCRDPCGNVVWKGSIFSGRRRDFHYLHALRQVSPPAPWARSAFCAGAKQHPSSLWEEKCLNCW